LWILLHTGVPLVVVAVVFVLNTVLAVGLQVPVSATATTLAGSARAYRRAGLALVATCLLLVASGRYDPGPGAGALLVAAVVALTFGEMLQSAAAWSAGYELAPERVRGSYLAVLGLGNNAQNVAGPVIVTAAVAAGAWGLVWLAGALLLASALTSAVV